MQDKLRRENIRERGVNQFRYFKKRAIQRLEKTGNAEFISVAEYENYDWS